MSKDLQVITQRELTARIDQPLELAVEDVLQQVKKIETIMCEVMVQDVHYGVIPGTEKPTLLKSGAEKLALTFRLRPSSEIRNRDLSGDHRKTEIILKLIHFPTDQIVDEGIDN